MLFMNNKWSYTVAVHTKYTKYPSFSITKSRCFIMHLRALYWLNNKINSATVNIRQPQSLIMQRWPCILFLGVSPDPVYKHRDKGQFLLYSGSYIAWPCVCVCGVWGSLIGLWTLNTYGHLLYRCANTLRPISTFYITWINTAGDETSVKMVWTCTI